MHEWINLTNYLGENFNNPTDSQLKDTLNQLFKTNDDEHPNAWISCGTEEGPLYSLDIYSGGFALYIIYNNAASGDGDQKTSTGRSRKVTGEPATKSKITRTTYAILSAIDRGRCQQSTRVG